MSCIKCGKDTGEGQVFCHACLAHMEDYPVKPGTPVIIPQQRQHFIQRKTQRKLRTGEPEDVIRRQKRLIRLLTAAVMVLLVAWGITTAIVVRMLTEDDKVPIGQNYGISTAIDDTGN